MLFSPYVAAASALFALGAVAAPTRLPPGKDLRSWVTTVYISPEGSQELVEAVGQAASEQGAEVLGYFGLSPNDDQNMGFKVRLNNDAENAFFDTLGSDAKFAFVVGSGFFGNFCPHEYMHC